MNAFTIHITDSASPALAKLRGVMAPSELHKGIATEVKRLVKFHFLTLGPNKRGWPTTNFWKGAAKNTSAAGDKQSATVSVNQDGVRQRYSGGWIKPNQARMLTIPISPEAAGKRARDFPGAFLLKTKKGAYIVQHGETFSAAGNIVKRRGKKSQGLGSKRTVAALEFLFKLSAGVHQDPDPGVLPDEATIISTALAEVDRNAEAALS